MSEVWQQMSSSERNEMRNKMQKATTAVQRNELREEYIQKYLSSVSSH